MNKYICRGRRITVGAERAELEGKLASVRERMQDVRADLRHPFDVKVAEIEQRLAMLSGVGDEQESGRAGCGHDLTDMIEAIPMDGEVYQYKCPRCGNAGTVRRVAGEPEAAA